MINILVQSQGPEVPDQYFLNATAAGGGTPIFYLLIFPNANDSAALLTGA